MGAKPQNPFLYGLLWLGYRVDSLEPWSFVAFAICLALGGGLVAVQPLVGALLIGIGAVMQGAELYWKRQGGEWGDTGAAREKLLEEVLQPLLERTASVVSMPKDERKRAADHEADMVVQRIAAAFDSVPQVRTVVFTVSDDGQRMDPIHHAGRPDRPGPFEKGTQRGDKAFEVLEGSEPYIWEPNLDTDHPTQWAGTGATYRTFITAPIRSRDEGFGLLTIDAPTAGTLDKRHGATMSLFAATLGVLYAEAARTTNETGSLSEVPRKTERGGQEKWAK